MKRPLHLIDLNTIVCVVGRVRDRGHWTFVDRSGPTAHVKMASPPPSSQGSDCTDFSTSDESETGSGSPSNSDSPMSDSSPSGINDSPMDLDTSSDSSG